MKKLLFAAVVGMALFTSCKRDWKCVCSTGSESGTAATYTDVTKKDAKSSCDGLQAIGIAFDSDFSCEIEKN